MKKGKCDKCGAKEELFFTGDGWFCEDCYRALLIKAGELTEEAE